MKKLIVILVFIYAITVINISTCYAQNYFYYSDGKKIPLTLSDQEIVLKFKIGTTSSEIQTLISQEPSLGESSLFSPASFKDFYGFKLKAKTDIEKLINLLRKNSKIEIANPVFLFNDDVKMRVGDRFVVQFQQSISKTEINILNALHHVEIVDTRTN